MHAHWYYTRVTDLEDEVFLSFADHKRALYDGALRYIDDTFALLLERLEALGVAGRTVIAVTSDHGEEFWDHAEIERRLGGDPRDIWGVDHGHSLFQELLRVPLIVSGPGVAAGRTVPCAISLLDLAPTLLEVVGVPAAAGMRGVSRSPALGPGPAPSGCGWAPVFAESPAYGINARSVLLGDRYKLIERADGVRLLFDLDEDPAERRDLAGERPELVEPLAGLLRGKPAEAESGEVLAIDETALATLRALGYLD
jgi:arylsulfatase A-like enzyme